MNSDKILAYLRENVAPKAAEIDLDPDVLREALNGLCALDAMALKRPLQFGGPAVSEIEFRVFQEEVARASGSLAFLQTQHQSAVSMIAKGSNLTLKSEWLPKMSNGEALVGIGFSQLRRAGPPILTADECSGGFILNGAVPWITGATFFHDFLIGAALPDGRSVFGIVPFGSDPQIRLSEPMKLAAMESARTVSAIVDRFLLKEKFVVDIKPKDWIHVNDSLNITLQGFFALGCARAALDVLQREAERRKLTFIENAWKILDEELHSLRQAMIDAGSVGEDVTTPLKLQLRAHAIELCTRCAHAAIAASGGAANSIDHPAQRIYREALVYTVSAQTAQIMEATLQRLLRDSRD